jgi:hypothetical protein
MRRPGFISAFSYTSISVLAAMVFLVITTLTGDYTWVARGGGAAWVFGLSTIILMPIVTPLVKKRMEK